MYKKIVSIHASVLFCSWKVVKLMGVGVHPFLPRSIPVSGRQLQLFDLLVLDWLQQIVQAFLICSLIIIFLILN